MLGAKDANLLCRDERYSFFFLIYLRVLYTGKPVFQPPRTRLPRLAIGRLFNLAKRTIVTLFYRAFETTMLMTITTRTRLRLCTWMDDN